MPELPDVAVYVERIDALLKGQTLTDVRLKSAFVVRTYEPPLKSLVGRCLVGSSRLGKRIVFEFDGDLHLVMHLMIAGRLQYRPHAAKLPGRTGLLALDFENASLLLTEAGTKKRASVHVVRGREQLTLFARDGVEPLEVTHEAFAQALLSQNRTLKRALTDPDIISGVGNAYSDEILFEAQLSPTLWTSRLGSEEIDRLYQACRKVLIEFTDRVRAEVGSGFPEKVTAFREDMAVHGRYGEPCRRCGAEILRIRYADNETNYCANCQTNGKLLRDRGLSRLLRGDWPRTLEDLEERRSAASRDVSRASTPSPRARRRG